MTAPLRRVAALATAAGLLVLGGLALGPARPVAGLDRTDGGIRVTENQTVEKEYGPISAASPVANLPDPAPRLNRPQDCREASYCDAVPLEIVLPADLTPADEFFVTVSLDWATDSVEGVSAGGNRYTRPQDVNDLDLYVWADTDPEPEEPVDFSTFTRPESIRLFRPVNVRYWIVVFNSRGPNTGYKLKVDYKAEKIETPFELLPPEIMPSAPPAEPGGTPVAPGPEPEAPAPAATRPVSSRPSGATPTLPAPPAPATGPAPLAPVTIEPDPDFANFADDAFDEQLAAPAGDVLTEKQVRAVGPPKPASTASLVFWLAVVPLLLVAAGGIWLAKKGSAVLKLR